MLDPRYITITVQYDPEPRYGRSLEWIAPELKDSALTMTDDHLNDPTPSRTWAGLVDGPTYEHLAEVWRLPKDTSETNPHRASDNRGPITRDYVLDGMNWEADNESPIVCVSLQVIEPASARRDR
jgi:hypothetical protein